MLKKTMLVLCLGTLASAASTKEFQLNLYGKPNGNDNKNNNQEDSYGAGAGYKADAYKSSKVKKAYGPNDWQLFTPDSPKVSEDFGDYPELETLPALPPPSPKGSNILYTLPLPTKEYAPTPHHHHHHKGYIPLPHKAYYIPAKKVHLITDIAGHKLEDLGHKLQSGDLDHSVMHKLSFAKASLLQLIAILAPLSAIKTINVVAKASHSSQHEHHVVDGHGDPYHDGPHHEGPHHLHKPSLVGFILNFIAQLSKFNSEAKLHLIPNLLKVATYASSASAHTSAHASSHSSGHSSHHSEEGHYR